MGMPAAEDRAERPMTADWCGAQPEKNHEG